MARARRSTRGSAGGPAKALSIPQEHLSPAFSVDDPGPLIGRIRVPPVGPEQPTQRFRVLRSLDLVALDVLCYRLEAVADSGGVALVPAQEGARLEVRYTFQHAIEAAEPEMLIPPPPAPVPIPARAAHGSRLVFAVPDKERIEWSSAGVLAAISRLPLLVAPLALPRVLPLRLRPGDLDLLVDAVSLPGGLRLARSPHGLVLAPALRSRASAAPHEPVRASRLISTAASLRTART